MELLDLFLGGGEQSNSLLTETDRTVRLPTELLSYQEFHFFGGAQILGRAFYIILTTSWQEIVMC